MSEQFFILPHLHVLSGVATTPATIAVTCAIFYGLGRWRRHIAQLDRK